MRGLASQYQEPIDIVLTHAIFRRRPWLLLLNTRLVVTGHFDTGLSLIAGKALLSMWSSPHCYALIDTHGGNWRATLHVTNPSHMQPLLQIRGLKQLRATASLNRGKLTCSSQSESLQAMADRPNYAVEVEALLQARSRIQQGLSRRADEERQLATVGVPQVHVNEFLAGL
jgi:hypothetical protein